MRRDFLLSRLFETFRLAEESSAGATGECVFAWSDMGLALPNLHALGCVVGKFVSFRGQY